MKVPVLVVYGPGVRTLFRPRGSLARASTCAGRGSTLRVDWAIRSPDRWLTSDIVTATRACVSHCRRTPESTQPAGISRACLYRVLFGAPPERVKNLIVTIRRSTSCRPG